MLWSQCEAAEKREEKGREATADENEMVEVMAFEVSAGDNDELAGKIGDRHGSGLMGEVALW